MKPTIKLIGVLVAVCGLAACTTPSQNQLTQKTVNYQCGPGGQDPMSVQYTFQGLDALSARIIYQNQVVQLPRSTSSNVDMVGNTFRSDNYTWITQAFDYNSVDSARGEMLTREIVPSAHDAAIPSDTTLPPSTGVGPAAGSRTAVTPAVPVQEVSNIIVRDCVPVTTTTSDR